MTTQRHAASVHSQNVSSVIHSVGIIKRLCYSSVCAVSNSQALWQNSAMINSVRRVWMWRQPHKLSHWQKQLVRIIQTHRWFSEVFPRYLSNVNTACRSALWKHPLAPTLLLFPPHADAVFRSEPIWTNIFSSFLWERSSVHKVVSVNAGLIAQPNNGIVPVGWIMNNQQWLEFIIHVEITPRLTETCLIHTGLFSSVK